MVKITSVDAPKVFGPYSQAIEHNNLIYLSGQLPIENGVMITDPALAIKAAIRNIEHVLKAADSSLSQVLKVTIYVTNINDFFFISEAYQEMFSEPYPARCLIEVKGLPKGAILEVECIAYK